MKVAVIEFPRPNKRVLNPNKINIAVTPIEMRSGQMTREAQPSFRDSGDDSSSPARSFPGSQ